MSATVARWAAGLVLLLAALLIPASGLHPVATAEPGPLLRAVHLAGQHVPVLITPQRPGANLVLVGGATGGVRVGTADLVEATERAGAGGRWAVVDLPAGSSTVWLELAGERVPVVVDAGRGAPAIPGVSSVDGPECAAATLGAALANPHRPLAACPADALSAADETSLSGLVGVLATRGVRTLTIAADGSARSTSAASTVRDAAERRGISIGADSGPDSALVVLSGWAAASTTLAVVAEQQRGSAGYPFGTYLAPWLLSASVVASATNAVIPLRFNPRDEQAVQYRLAIGTRFHGQSPTAAGYLGWLAAKGLPQPSGTRLYATSRVAFMPAELGVHQHGHDAGWVPGGTIVAVTGVVDQGG